MKSIERSELEKFLEVILNTKSYQDYGPNGLQIEGQDKITKIAFAVSAQKESIEKAVAMKANCLIVHHGLFWTFHGTRTITGAFAKRVKPLIENGINLFGYHLPLDGHLEIGNAAGLAKAIGLHELSHFGDYKNMPTGVKGTFTNPISANELKQRLGQILSHNILHANFEEKSEIESVGIITGGANSGWRDALKDGLDAYISGEMSEHDYHEAREAGIHMFAGGHNATERFGVLSLMDLISKNFDIECVFIDSENPA